MASDLLTLSLVKALMFIKSIVGLTYMHRPVLGDFLRVIPIPRVPSFKGIFVWKQTSSSLRSSCADLSITKSARAASFAAKAGSADSGPLCLHTGQVKSLACLTAAAIPADGIPN